LWVAPWPGVGSVADASIEASLDAVGRLGEGSAVEFGQPRQDSWVAIDT